MITADELTQTLVDGGIPKSTIQLFDEYYIFPTENWISKELGASLNKFFFDTGIKYQDDQYDCNKFAKTASTIADWCWAKTKVKDAALAFGIFGFMRGFGHAINIAVHRDANHKLYLAFYEPQPSIAEGSSAFSLICLTKLNLTKEDIQSCVTCLFL